MGDSEARFRRPHGTAVCGERRKRGPDLACVPSVIHVGASAEQLRAAAQRRQGPGSSDGRFVTLRVCHWMAVGFRQVCGRLSAAKPCICSAAKCVRLRRRGCDGFVLFTHSAWVWRASPIAIRWLGGDLRSGQRREYHPNMPAPALRREWPPLEASHRPRQCNGTFGGLCVKVRKFRPKSPKSPSEKCESPQSPSEKSDNSRFSRFMIRAKTRWAEQRPHRGAGCEEEDQRHRHRGAAYKEEDRRERHPRHRRSAVRRRRQTQRRRDATDRARPCRAAPTGALPAFRNRSRAITSST